MSEALATYLKHEEELHQLFLMGTDESVEGEALADKLHDLWRRSLTPEERQEIRNVITARKRK